MKFFVEQEFPPPDLNPKSRKLAARCEKITNRFFKKVKRLDEKMWVEVCKLMVDRRNFYCEESDALDRALDGIMEQLESTSKIYHRKIEALGEMLNIEVAIYPFMHMHEHVKAELIDIAQVSFEYYRALGEMQGFLLHDE